MSLLLLSGYDPPFVPWAPSFADLLDWPNVRKVFLLDLTAGESLTHWTVDTGGWYAVTAQTVVGLRIDGQDIGAMWWTWDVETGHLWVDDDLFADPNSHAIEAIVAFYVSNHAKRFSGITYEPRIRTAPSLEQKIERRFAGIGTVGGGGVSLDNSDGFFDDLQTLNWDGGTAVLRLGLDLPQTADSWLEMDLADYETQGTWYVSGWTPTRQAIELDFRELSQKIQTKVPQQFFTRDVYPNCSDDALGKPIPFGHGQLHRIPAYCIDTETRTFKVFNHACYSLSGCTVAGASTAFATFDLSDSTFTLASYDTSDGQVLVDAIGRVTAGGDPMVSPVDVIEDYLTVWSGPADINSASFATARAAQVVGTNRSGLEVHEYEIARYVGESTEDLLDLVAEVAAAAALIIRQNASGEFEIRAWSPIQSEGAAELVAADEKEVSSAADTTDVITQVAAHYAKRAIGGSSELVEVESDEAKYRRGLPGHLLLDEDIPIGLLRCAERWASRTLAMESQPARTIEAEVSHRAYGLVPGNPIRITFDRVASGYYEVLESSMDLDAGRLRLVTGDWRGLGTAPGFWVSDTPTFPTRLGGASCETWDAGWTAEQKRWAVENVGYWSDDNRFLDPDDPDSYRGSVWA